MFQRKVYGYLKNWKEESDGSSAVLIEGPGVLVKVPLLKHLQKPNMMSTF